MLVTLLSDFGLEDEWVSVCRAVILETAPDVTLLDISHCIAPFDIRRGAFVLAAAVSQMSQAVHMAVVDPGVGSERMPLAILTGRGDILVGPDNGLLIPAADRLGGIVAVHEISSERFTRAPVCPTFHARDIFAPAAALLAAGAPISDAGRALDAGGLRPGPWKPGCRANGRLVCQVIDVDHFGTVRLSLVGGDLEEFGFQAGEEFELGWAGRRVSIPLREVFSDVPEGSTVGLVDSSGYLCVAVNQRSATRQLGLRVGDEVELKPVASEAAGSSIEPG